MVDNLETGGSQRLKCPRVIQEEPLGRFQQGHTPNSGWKVRRSEIDGKGNSEGNSQA